MLELNLFHVGVAGIEGKPHDREWSMICSEIVAHALGQRDSLPVRGVLLFATPDWCRPGHSVSKPLRVAFRRELGYHVPVIGGSFPRIFVSAPLGGAPAWHFIESGLAIATLCSRDIWMDVQRLESPYLLSLEPRKRALEEMIAKLNHSRMHRTGLGSSVQVDLFAMMPGLLHTRSGLLAYRDIELHEEIRGACNHEIALFGASTSGGPPVDSGYQFAGDECLQSGLAMALIESDLCQGTAMLHGLTPQSQCRTTVTQLAENALRGYVVTQLDGQPAAERVAEMVSGGSIPLTRPIFGIGTSPNCQVAISGQKPCDQSTSIHFSRPLRLGTTLFPLSSDDRDLEEASLSALRTAALNAKSDKDHHRMYLGFECLTRYESPEFMVEEARWRSTCSRIAKEATDVPVIMAMCAGQFGEDSSRRPRADHHSSWFVCLTARNGPRSENRLLHIRLLDSLRAVLNASSPKDVMRAALDGAIAAGAAGGQITVVDQEMGLILGPHHGHAVSAKNLGQPWEIILAQTIRKLTPKGKLFRLSEALAECAVYLTNHPSDVTLDDVRAGDDLLTLIAANKQAVYIPDSTDINYHCDPDAVAAGHVHAQLAAPLIGSAGQSIAILQIGFPKDHPMDRASIAAWVNYSMTVSAALERAWELEEREQIKSITDEGNRLMGTAMLRTVFPEDELRRFTDQIRQLLAADYVHLRVRNSIQNPLDYALLAPAGSLADLHRRVRPSLAAEEGSVRTAREEGEVFANTEAETRELYHDVNHVIAGVREHDARQWARENRSIHSGAVLALRDRDKFLGALVIDSRIDYFFTERKKRVARVAAAKLSAILSKLTAESRLQTLVQQGLFAATTIHDCITPLTNIQRAIDLLRTGDNLERNLLVIQDARNAASKLLHEIANKTDLASTAIPIGDLFNDSPNISCDIAYRPPSIANACVVGNFWLRRAMQNLVQNAIEEAGTSDAPVCQVVVSSMSCGDRVQIVIENNGVELAPEQVSDMEAAGYSNKRGDHLGLGVPLARFGIESFNGNLHLEPRAGGGMIAVIQLPIQPTDLDKERSV